MIFLIVAAACVLLVREQMAKGKHYLQSYVRNYPLLEVPPNSIVCYTDSRSGVLHPLMLFPPYGLADISMEAPEVAQVWLFVGGT